jgi:protein TonB
VVRPSAYWLSVRAAIARELRYPDAARRQGAEGVVNVWLAVGPDGELVAARPVTSVTPTLSEAAIAAIRRAAPFPAPTNAPNTTLGVVLPIRFRLQATPVRSSTVSDPE